MLEAARSVSNSFADNVWRSMQGPLNQHKAEYDFDFIGLSLRMFIPHPIVFLLQFRALSLSPFFTSIFSP